MSGGHGPYTGGGPEAGYSRGGGLAHAIGAEYKGKKCGSLGDFGAFSFHTIKNMTTLGEGGMLTTDDPEAFESARLHRFVGRSTTGSPITTTSCR